MKLLLDKEADVNALGGHYGTVLQTASAGHYETIVKLLLEKEADVNAQKGYYHIMELHSRQHQQKVMRQLWSFS